MDETAGSPMSVLVAGGGPSGLVSAALLAQLGISVTVVERYARRRMLPKAHVINPVSLDIFRQLGYDLDALIGEAAKPADDRVVRFCDRLIGRDLGVLPFEYQEPGWVAHQRINLPQPRLEQLLEDRVRRLDGVTWVVGRWQDVELEGDSCVSHLSTDRGDRRIVSDYVIGADGANSVVRERLGVKMEGPGSVQECVTVHFRAELRPWLQGREAAIYQCVDTEATGAFVAHNIDTDWVFTYFPESGEPGDLATARERVQRAIGRPDVPVEILAVSPWQLASLVAQRFRVGSVFLVGDAAHRLPPSGGLGLNTGVQDAANLAWKLVAVARGWAEAGILDSYDLERRPVAERNTGQSHENYRSIRTLQTVLGTALSDGTLGFLSDFEIASVINDQWVGYNNPALQLGYAYTPVDGPPVPATGRYVPSSAVGARVPHTMVSIGGRTIAVHDLFDYREFVLLVTGDPRVWQPLAGSLPVPVRIQPLLAGGVDDPDWLRLMELDGPGAVLVRPDGHVAGRLRTPADVEPMCAALASFVSSGRPFPR